MKQGTKYAARLKQVYEKLRKTVAAPQVGELEHPLRRLVSAVLGVSTNHKAGEQALDRLLSTMVDWNEVRVSTPAEIHAATGSASPDGLQQCRRLLAALDSIYLRENDLNLDRLRSLPRREAKQYLEGLNGVDEYTVASVMLWGLGGHAIPVDDELLAALCDADLVHPDASRAEVQAFLERNISAAQAEEFCVVMRSFASERRTSVTARQAEAAKARSAKKTKSTRAKASSKAGAAKTTKRKSRRKVTKSTKESSP